METVIRREDGSRVKIKAYFHAEYRDIEYRCDVYTCEPKKRTWKNVYDSNCYKYRCLSMEDRKKYVAEKELEVVSPEELHQAKINLWESLKP